jgi:uncharacterized protein YkwD
MTLTKQQRRRETANRRKLNGAHHRKTDKHYAKAYWPYIPIFAVLGVGLLANLVIHRHDHSVLGYATNISSKVLLAETNAARTANHEDALELNAALSQAAQAKANDMAQHNYWSHVTPDGRQPWSFIDATPYQYLAAGENLAYGFGDSDQVVTAWLNSPEHRANLLNHNYRDVGFATANVANYQGHGPETITVALYAQPTNLNAVTHATSNYENLTTPQQVSRLQVITTATWVQLLLAALCGAAFTLFIVRHAIAWHKLLHRGEDFVLKHPLWDTMLIAIVVGVCVVYQAAGTIL